TTYLTLRQPPLTTSLFPYTTLFRSPEAAPLQVQVEPLEAQLFRARLAEAKVEQGQFEAEGIELEALQAGRHRGVLGELLIGYALGNSRQDQEAKQAIADQGGHRADERALHSVGHAVFSSRRLSGLEYGMRIRFLSVRCAPVRRPASSSRLPHAPTGAVGRTVADRPAQQRRGLPYAEPDQLSLAWARLQFEQGAGPIGQQLDTGLHHQGAERPGQRAGRGSATQHAKYFPRAFVAAQLRPYGGKVVQNLLPGARYVAGPEAFGDQCDFGVIAILLAAGQRWIEIAQVRLEKAADLGHMHPGQQVRIIGGIGA